MTHEKENSQNLENSHALAVILNWDFNPTRVRKSTKKTPGIFIINPILMTMNSVVADDLPKIVKGFRGRGVDILNNDSYPIFDGDSQAMLVGNILLAYELVKQGLATLITREVSYPIYC